MAQMRQLHTTTEQDTLKHVTDISTIAGGYITCRGNNGSSLVKQSHNTLMEAQRERIYTSYSFTTSALEEGEWSASRPGRALPWRTDPPLPFVQEAGWAPEPVWTQVRGKMYYLCRGSNLDRPVVHSVVRDYTA
jgi:hypothetical protein